MTREPALPGVQVLFVDDDPLLLAGLRRALHKRLDGWSLHFAGSGAEALAHLEARHVDVVVSDMRMPGMDGARLLKEVRTRWPATARVILSGQADRDSVVAAADSAHQFLFKPCDVDTLVGSLNRLIIGREVLDDPIVAELVASTDHLPVMPHLYRQIMDVTQDPGATPADVVAVVSGDMAVAAGLLKLVNSDFFGFSRRVGTVEEAVVLLGPEVVTALVVAESVFRPGDLPAWVDAEGLRARAVLGSSVARLVARGEGWGREETNLAVLATLLRDVGVLVVAQRPWSDTDRLDAGLREPWLRAEREYEVFGCRIPTVSAGLLSMWCFPEVVVHAVAAQPALPFENGLVLTEHVVAFAYARSLVAPGEHVGDHRSGSMLDHLRVARWNAVADSALTPSVRERTGSHDEPDETTNGETMNGERR